MSQAAYFFLLSLRWILNIVCFEHLPNISGRTEQRTLNVTSYCLPVDVSPHNSWKPLIVARQQLDKNFLAARNTHFGLIVFYAVGRIKGK
jgi:hypothetical protein